MKSPLRKVFLLIAFIFLSAQLLFAQTPNNNSSVKIEIKNSRYIVSGVVSSEAVKNEIIGKVSEISGNNAEFSGLKIDSRAEPFAVDWQKGFGQALFKSKLWKSGVFIFAANRVDEYPELPGDILNGDIFLTDSNKPIRIADYRNKVVVLFLLATWCRPCIQQADELNDFYSSVSPNDVEIIGVNIDADEKEAFPEFVRRGKYNYKMGAADRKLYEAALKISKFPGIPQAFLSRDGKLYGVFTGNSPQTIKKLKETILKLSKTR